MPFDALSAKARLMVPVGAMDSRCELRRPCERILSLSACGRRDAKLPPERYRSALNSGKLPRSAAMSLDAAYAASRITSLMWLAMSRAACVS
jgi:hypothetical protein